MTRSIYTLAGVLAAALAVPSPAAADRAGQRSRTQARQSAPQPAGDERRSFAVAPGATLDIANVAGNVRITAGDADAVVVDAVRRRGDSRRSADPRVEMRQIGNRIEVRTRGTGSRRSSTAVDFTVTVPRDTVVLARSISGQVALRGVDGEVRIESVSGRVEAVQSANLALLKSVSGDVVVRDGASAGTLTLATVSGTVRADGVRGRGLEATTVSGAVQLRDIATARVFAKAVSGSLEFGGSLAADGRYEFTAHSGDIRLQLPAGAGFDLQADTYSGRLSSDFAVTLRSTRTGRGATQTLRGVAGDGAAQLVVRSFSGDIILTRR
ncbi:MAG: DUF4097 domain-containing protein [Vicinamibacterales bacterium]